MKQSATARIIYLNGSSSSGKTTLALKLRERLPGAFLYVSIDQLIDTMPRKVNNWEGGLAPEGFSWKASVDPSGATVQEIQTGPLARQVVDSFYAVVLTLANRGHNLIIDDVAFGKEDVDRWRQMLKGFQVLYVGVEASLEILEEREKQRGNRMIGSARGMFRRVHEGVAYDIRVDTGKLSLEDCVAQVCASISR